MSRLKIIQGSTHYVESGETEEWEGATVDGTLDVDGTLKLVDNPNVPSFDVDSSPIDLPLKPLNLSNMQIGTSIFLIGIVGALGGIAAALRNYAALVMLMLAVTGLLASGLLGIGLETFWALILATVLTIMAGMVARWVTG